MIQGESAPYIIYKIIIYGITLKILSYFLKYHRYYRLAFQWALQNQSLPEILRFLFGPPSIKLNIYQLMRKLGEKKNSVKYFSSWMPRFMVIGWNADDLETVLTHKSLPDKSWHYGGIDYYVGPAGLVSAKGEMFQRSKKVFLRSFNNSSQEILFENIIRGSESIIALLEPKVNQGWFAMGPIIRKVTLKNLIRAAFDEDLPDGSDFFRFTSKNDKMEQILMTVTMKSLIEDLPFVASLGLLHNDILENSKALLRQYSSRLQNDRKNDMTEKLKRNEEIPNQFIYNILRERADEPIDCLHADIITIIAAAVDTSSVTFACTLILLSMYPDVQQKVFEEDRRIQIELGGRKMVESDMAKYEYTQRVVKETLRLYPAVPLTVRAVEDDVTLGGGIVPKGSSVGTFIPNVHRDPDHWRDPIKYDPDRFLPENVEKRHKFAYIPFSFGRHQCPGSRYAYNSVICHLVSVIRKYQVFAKYESVKEMDDNISGFTIMSDKNDFQICLKAR